MASSRSTEFHSACLPRPARTGNGLLVPRLVRKRKLHISTTSFPSSSQSLIPLLCGVAGIPLLPHLKVWQSLIGRSAFLHLCTCLSVTTSLFYLTRLALRYTGTMRRRRPYVNHESSLSQPKWKRASFVKREIPTPGDRDTVPLLCVIACLILYCASYLLGSRRPKPKVLPNIPWVGRDRKKWFSKLRARTWTTVHYEAALKDAYAVVTAFLQH